MGGVMATLLGDELAETTGARVIRGLLNRPGILDAGDRICIDNLTPDYRIFEGVDHPYNLDDAYVAYATRGCPNSCAFCAVSVIEPEFVHYLPLKGQSEHYERLFGPRRDLILLDNNVLASDKFEQIIDDICELGFHRGAKLNSRSRSLDFNQGVDLRLLTREKMQLLARTAIKPLRVAFDRVSLKKRFISRVRMASDAGIRCLSSYVLYNYLDTPQDFYERLRTNATLARETGCEVYSFPMKYIPLDAKDRSHVGKHWSRRLLRGVQCILVATKGVVSPNLDFFEAAFGHSAQEFMEIAMMPDDYIIERRKYESNSAGDWRRSFRRLTPNQRELFISVVARGKVTEADMICTQSRRVRDLFAHYLSRTGGWAHCEVPTPA